MVITAIDCGVPLDAHAEFLGPGARQAQDRDQAEDDRHHPHGPERGPHARGPAAQPAHGDVGPEHRHDHQRDRRGVEGEHHAGHGGSRTRAAGRDRRLVVQKQREIVEQEQLHV
jgi:hypothetical protein